MLGTRKVEPELDTTKVLDGIQRAVYAEVKPYGFRKHGRTLHRFVSGDISQVIHFQLGQAHMGETHLLFVNTGIRVPECMTLRFTPEVNPKKYYQAHECNIRSRLGTIEGGQEACYDLRRSTEEITADILRQVTQIVLPVFEILNSRDAILARRGEFPQFDILNSHLILLEEAMIYGRRGETERAAETFRLYYRLFGSGQLAQKNPRAIAGHLRYLEGLAGELGMSIS